MSYLDRHGNVHQGTDPLAPVVEEETQNESDETQSESEVDLDQVDPPEVPETVTITPDDVGSLEDL